MPDGLVILFELAPFIGVVGRKREQVFNRKNSKIDCAEKVDPDRHGKRKIGGGNQAIAANRKSAPEEKSRIRFMVSPLSINLLFQYSTDKRNWQERVIHVMS